MHAMLGIISTGARPILLSVCENTSSDTTLYVFYDRDRRGVAYARNEVIRAFEQSAADVLFLMDDDVELSVPGWERVFLEHPHLNFAGYPNPRKGPPANSLGGMSFWRFITGAFYYMTREHLRQVGYFNTKLGRYGWTDVGYMERARRIYGPTFAFPIQALPMILPRDIYFGNPSRSEILSREEKDEWIERNRPVHEAEIAGPTYLPYEQ